MRRSLKQTQTNQTPQHHNPQLLQFWNVDTNCSYIWQPFYINNLIQIGFRRCFLTPQTVHGLISVARKLCYSLQQKSIWNTYCGLQGLTVSNEQNMLAQFHPYYNWNQFKKSLQWSKTQPPPLHLPLVQFKTLYPTATGPAESSISIFLISPL